VDPLAELGGWLLLTGVAALLLIGWVRLWNARRRKFWAPLAPIVDGHARGFRMVGAYDRHEVIAETSPVHDAGPRSPNNSPWFFSTSMDPVPDRDRRQRGRTMFVPAGVNWTVRYEQDGGWQIVTPSDPIREALTRMGLLTDLQQWMTYPTILYSPRSKLITIEEDFPVQMTPERFRSRLDLLTRLARVNQELNFRHR
jgi:hypothetical protein